MKKIISLITSILLVLSFSIPVFAREAVNYCELNVSLLNPLTNEQIKYTKSVPIKQKSILVPLSGKNTIEIINEANSVISLGEYIKQSYGKEMKISATQESGYSVNDSDIKIKTGLKWYSKGENIKLTHITGAVENKGLFYAGNKRVSWRNSVSGNGGVFYPTTNSWSKSVTDSYSYYYRSLAPYSILDVIVHVSGMSSTRKLSVRFDILTIS